MEDARPLGATATAPEDAGPATEPSRPVREPVTRAPWPAVAVAASILLAFAVQSGVGSVEAWNERFGLRPSDLEAGRLTGLIGAMWSHANWTHAGMNAVFALAFGAPVARLFGLRAKGVALFALLYLVGGVIASLGFVAVHMKDDILLVGASGAVSALTGAAARLIGPAGAGPGGRLSPFTSASVIGMSFAFVTANLILGVVGLDLGQGDAPLAWEAHLAGYAAGLFLIAPFTQAALSREPAPSD
ncbi:rhomboid family intramembrane serine protease [soil metagenome]